RAPLFAGLIRNGARGASLRGGLRRTGGFVVGHGNSFTRKCRQIKGLGPQKLLRPGKRRRGASPLFSLPGPITGGPTGATPASRMLTVRARAPEAAEAAEAAEPDMYPSPRSPSRPRKSASPEAAEAAEAAAAVAAAAEPRDRPAAG